MASLARRQARGQDLQVNTMLCLLPAARRCRGDQGKCRNAGLENPLPPNANVRPDYSSADNTQQKGSRARMQASRNMSSVRH